MLGQEKKFYEKIDLRHHCLLREMMEQRGIHLCRREGINTEARSSRSNGFYIQAQWSVLEVGTRLPL